MHFATILLYCGWAPLVCAQTAPKVPVAMTEKREAIQRLLVLIGFEHAEVNLTQVAVQLWAKDVKTEDDRVLLDKFEKRFRAELEGLVIDAHAKHLTYEDIQQLIKFYESGAGAKWSVEQPRIEADLIQAIAAWAQKTAAEITGKDQ